MPLIDDDSLVTDRKQRSWWPWVIVAGGFALLWLIFAFAITFLPRALSNTITPPSSTGPLQSRQSSAIKQAQQMVNFGSPGQAVTILSSIDPTVPMSLIDKHTYFRVSAKSLAATGSPLAASRYFDRFLTLGLGVHSAECRSCHDANTQISPTRLRDLLQSDLGKAYVAALTSAGKVKATRSTLRAQLKKNAKDARAHLLLYHIAVAREEDSEAVKHSLALQKLDDEAAAKASSGN